MPHVMNTRMRSAAAPGDAQPVAQHAKGLAHLWIMQVIAAISDEEPICSCDGQKLVAVSPVSEHLPRNGRV